MDMVSRYTPTSHASTAGWSPARRSITLTEERKWTVKYDEKPNSKKNITKWKNHLRLINLSGMKQQEHSVVMKID